VDREGGERVIQARSTATLGVWRWPASCWNVGVRHLQAAMNETGSIAACCLQRLTSLQVSHTWVSAFSVGVLRSPWAMNLLVKRGVSGLEQGLCLIVAASCEFLIGEQHQKMGVEVHRGPDLGGFAHEPHQAKALENDRKIPGRRSPHMDRTGGVCRHSLGQVRAFT
jgi:hypothetical protein